MTPPILVCFVDESGSADVAAALPRIVATLGRQLAEHVAPTWGRVVPVLSFGGVAPAGASPIVIRHDTEHVDALGYHDESPEGVPYAHVFVNPILSSGGSLCESANSLSATLSHELLELVGDPCANLWADGPDGFGYALELCDPCDGEGYAVNGVFVSNFVFPGYFAPQGASNVRLDYLRRLTVPFTTTPSGYHIRRGPDGVCEPVWGSRVRPRERVQKAQKSARYRRARTA